LIVTSNIVNDDDIGKLIISDDLPNEPPMLRAYIEAKVYDKEGHIIQYHRQPMRSLTQYFLALMSIPLIGTYQSSSTAQATGLLTNILGLPSQYSGNFGIASIGWNWSIQLGSGTQTFSPSVSNLAAPISNGTGAGQLSYGSTTASLNGSTIAISVTVINYTSSTINVTEIGLWATIGIYFTTGTGCSGTTYSRLLSYDTFPTTIAIPAGSTAMFQIQITFSG
jgi:hypothetical protein